MCVPEFSMSPDLLRLNFEHATMVAASTRKADGLNSQIPVVEGREAQSTKNNDKKPSACHDGITIRIGK